MLTSVKLFISTFIILFTIYSYAAAPLAVSGAKSIATKEAKALFDKGALFIDPRRESDWENGRIPDAEHLELSSTFNETTLLKVTDNNKAMPIVFYCNGPKCKRSAQCSELALQWGFTNVFYYRDGFPAWQAAGYPVE